MRLGSFQLAFLQTASPSHNIRLRISCPRITRINLWIEWCRMDLETSGFNSWPNHLFSPFRSSHCLLFTFYPWFSHPTPPIFSITVPRWIWNRFRNYVRRAQYRKPRPHTKRPRTSRSTGQALHWQCYPCHSGQHQNLESLAGYASI